MLSFKVKKSPASETLTGLFVVAGGYGIPSLAGGERVTDSFASHQRVRNYLREKEACFTSWELVPTNTLKSPGSETHLRSLL